MTHIPPRAVDLNADLGEHDGDGYDRDLAILDVVTSASIACGAHAGSHEVILRTIAAAAEKGVSIGAHPGYPDREGFGRREVGLSVNSIVESMSEQMDHLATSCAEAGATLAYVKPHGAMYNRSVRDQELARAIAEAIAVFHRSLTVLTLPDSALGEESERAGLKVAREAFIDRAYMPDGTLVSRDRDDALIHDVGIAAGRAVQMVRDGQIAAIDGSLIHVMPQSLCVHGDSRNALETVAEARRQLEAAGISIERFAP